MTYDRPDNEEDLADTAASVFQTQWRTYRKIIDNNYMYHREVYDRLRRLLIEEIARPFRFLDIACGDASASVTALAGTKIAGYYGIDLSEQALELAREGVATLACPAVFEQQDFVEALRHWATPIDVAWIGQSLHHLPASGKLAVMRRVHDIIGEQGSFLIWEAVCFDGENRDAWFHRYEQLRPTFTSISQEEWDAMSDHTRASDIPETDADWRRLGYQAGYESVRQLFVAPHRLSAMYCFGHSTIGGR